MKYYKDENNQIYAYESDGSQDEFIPNHLVKITDAERKKILETLTPEQMGKYISAYRREVENGGLEVGGVLVQTDSESRANLLGALQLGVSVNWKTRGGFVELTPEQISDISSAVGLHIQKCFNAEKVVQEEHKKTPYTKKADAEAAFDRAYNV